MDSDFNNNLNNEVSSDEAKDLKAKFEEAGATIELK